MTPQERRDSAIAVHGETATPEAVGFVLADGRWLDLGFRTARRIDDHRIVGGLLLTGEGPNHAEVASSTEAMLRWMDKAQAARVSLWEGIDGRQGLCQFPRDKEATLAVLNQKQSLLRLFRLTAVISLEWRDYSYTTTVRQMTYYLSQVEKLCRS